MEKLKKKTLLNGSTLYKSIKGKGRCDDPIYLMLARVQMGSRRGRFSRFPVFCSTLRFAGPRARLLTSSRDAATRRFFFAASLLHAHGRHEHLLTTTQMHAPAPRTPAVAALVVVVKAPMLLLHYMSMTFFCNEAQSTALSSSHDFHLCKSRSIQSGCGRSCSASSGGHRVRGCSSLRLS